MTREEIEKKFRFELELEMGKYKVKHTKNHKIAYFVHNYYNSYNLLTEFENILNRLGYRKVGYPEKNYNCVKIFLDNGTYRCVMSAPYFGSTETPKNRIPDFVKEISWGMIK